MITSKNKKGPIVLITGDISYVFPSGYGYLAGYLVERGEEVKILIKPKEEKEYPEFIKKIIELNPLLTGFGGLYGDLPTIKQFIANLSGRDFPIVIGGQMVTPTPEFAVEVTGADIGVIGEGEIILYKLVQALRAGSEIAKVGGLVINHEGKQSLTGPGEIIEDLSKLPKIPYDLFPSTDWLNVGRMYLAFPQPHNQFTDRTVTIHGGRGCPFHCNFCYHHSRARYRPIPAMMEDAETAIKKFNANHLFFDDDLAMVTPQRAQELMDGIKKLSKPVEYSMSVRMDIISRTDDRLLKEMKLSGCRCLGPGIESGSQRILDIMNKKITVDQIITGLRRLKNAGILTTSSIMVGQLDERPEDIQKSIDLMLETLRYDKNINYFFTVCTPFPGSDLYRICFEKGILKTHYDFFKRFNQHGNFTDITVNLTKMSDQELMEWYKKLKMAYRLEKRKAVGPRVFKIEQLMTRANRLDGRLKNKYLNKLTGNFFGELINKIYNFFYNLMQICFEKVRLYLLGIKKFKI
jgi:radical SAM superfamily enzyme YgiQ (UPF0313 family)